MSEIAGHAPLLYALLLGNQNNNNGQNGANGPTPKVPSAATLIATRHIAELQSKLDFEHQATELGTLKLRAATSDYQCLTHIGYNDFHRNGFLVLPDALSYTEADTLLEVARTLMDRASKEEGEGVIHHEVSPDGSNAPSAIGRVLATFETNKNPQWPLANPSKSTAKARSSSHIARLGCGIHINLPPFHHLTHSLFHRHLATTLLHHTDPRITQSQIIAKPPHVGGMIVPHQDGCVSFTDPASALTFWYALEDATVQNGCLMVARGSHLLEPIRQRMIRTGAGGGGGTFEDLAKPVWATSPHVDGSIPARETSVGEGRKGIGQEYAYESVEVKKGGLVVLHGNLMHRSGRNESDRGRMAYTFTVVDGACTCPDDTYMKPVGGEFERL